MKAFVVERYGDAGTVRAGDVPDPTAGAHDVLVRIHAASVNPVDLKIRDGDLKAILPLRAPFVLGNDLADMVVAVGAASHASPSATRSTHTRTRTGWARSRNSSPSTRTMWRLNQPRSPWRRPPLLATSCANRPP